ncbi:hypothetical protein A45J_1845 [hot springs metagenome]|uniref:Uncharacterized protein n=1 Tax=hot springs metagenome TaxID=433727 RepID=A0A5J4L5L3_9ZZZZ
MLRNEHKIDSVLYIPHGSDEISKLSVTLLSSLMLYIPHGSDEMEYKNKQRRC